MKTKIYIRVGKDPHASPNRMIKCEASSIPDFRPIMTSTDRAIPTVNFCLEVEIPDSEFTASRILLEAKIQDTKPAVVIQQVKEE